MSLKATFSTGSDTTTVRGLYQWDYGQVLEIESVDIGSEIVEVHFACANMTEAIVRSCAFTDGIGNVTIPDACLEQSTPVTAWVYQISGTQGHTTKVITLPIIARTRPSVAPDIPIEISNRYTELITEINKAVESLENGDVTVAKAANATNASHATSAGNAGSANFATSASSAATLSKMYLHIYQISMDVLARADGTKQGTLYLKFNVTAPNESLSKNLLNELIYTASNTPHYFEGFYVEGDNYYPLISYTCNSAEGGFVNYTLSCAHKSVIGKSNAYTPVCTTHKLY